jgi:predicted TPR repeat methyltransferase
MIDGDVDGALARYPDLAGDDAEDVLALAEEALSIFGVFDQEAAARAVGRWLADRRPDDAVLAYRVQVLEGAPLTKASPDYVAAHFDAFADRFDHQLAELLEYDAPQLLADLIATQRDRFADVVDLGCGTGLAAPALACFGGRLTGVDLSAGMLAKAAQRGAYDDLVQADVVDYLRSQPARFDLIFAADVLIYIGDLTDLFAAAAGALRSGGVLAITTEIAPEGWALLSSGRFSHAAGYVARMAGPAFDVAARETITLRREGLTAISGHLHLLVRR